MDLHSRALTCPGSRALLVQRVTVEGWTVSAASEALGVSRRTGHKWLRRYRLSGLEGLHDLSSRPRRMPRATPEDWEELIARLRGYRMTGPQIARLLRLPRATVARVLKRVGLERLKLLEPREPVRRYEWSRPGDLLHLDVKKLGRIAGVGHRIHGDRSRQVGGAGWEFVHVAVDDYTRLAYVEILPNERGDTTAAFLRRAIAWYKRQGIRILRILSDNGGGYISHPFAECCRAHRVRHRRTRPYRPCTNGKAERFIQTLLREWAYAIPYPSSKARMLALPRWLGYYNQRRPHSSLHGRSPISRLEGRCEQRS